MFITLSESPPGVKIKRRLGVVRKAIELPGEAPGLPPSGPLLEELFDEAVEELLRQVLEKGGNALIGLRSVSVNGQGVVLLYGEAALVENSAEGYGRKIEAEAISARHVDRMAGGEDPESLFRAYLGLDEERAHSLHAAGYRTLEEVAEAEIRDLLKVKGMNPTLARKIKEKAERFCKG